MSTYYELASSTNFKRKRYKASAENAGTFVISVDTPTKQALVDGLEFTTNIELNDPELANAIKQKSNVKGWQIAFEVASGTTILLGRIIGVSYKEVSGKEETILTCLLSNGLFVIVEVIYDIATKEFACTLTGNGNVDKPAIKVNDIENLPSELCDSLECGQIVIKVTGEEEHAYIVSYKKDDEMSLTYVDHSCSEEVYYEKSEDTWAFIVKDITMLGGTKVVANPTGTATDTLTKVDIDNVIYQLAGGMEYLAPEYDELVTYNESDLCVYNNALYSCKEDNVSGAWDNTKWETTTIAESVLGLLNRGA